MSDTGVVPPPDDDAEDAIPTSGGGLFSGNNEFATIEIDEPVLSCQDGQGASVWYVYESDAGTTSYVDLSRFTFDTVLAGYNGNTDAEVACDDDGGTFLTSRIRRVVVPGGIPSFIRVAGFDGTSLGGVLSVGDFTLQVESYDGVASETSAFSQIIDPGAVFNRPTSDGDGAPGSCFTSTDEVAFNGVDLSVGANGVYDFTATWGGYDGYLLLHEGVFNPATPCAGLSGRDDDFDPAPGTPWTARRSQTSSSTPPAPPAAGAPSTPSSRPPSAPATPARTTSMSSAPGQWGASPSPPKTARRARRCSVPRARTRRPRPSAST